jgi:3-hydroxyisobutyrate dehydrogenase
MAELGPGATIGFAGLGNMGTPMAARLIAAGYTVIGFDPEAAAGQRLAGHGGRIAAEVAELGKADAVILMLPNSAVVRAVLIEDGLRDALAEGAIVIDMSSSEPLQTRELVADLAAHGVRMVDAPVSGGVKGAQNGTLTIMVGGPDADVAQVNPVLAALGKPKHVGPAGAGHALKALNNLMSATHLWITSEAMLVGKEFGLDPTVMLDAVNGSSGRSGSTENKWPNFIVPRSFDSGFGLRLMLKDMKIATALARDLGLPSALGEAAVQHWASAADDLPADADHTRVAEWLEEHQGDQPS